MEPPRAASGEEEAAQLRPEVAPDGLPIRALDPIGPGKGAIIADLDGACRLPEDHPGQCAEVRTARAEEDVGTLVHLEGASMVSPGGIVRPLDEKGVAPSDSRGECPSALFIFRQLIQGLEETVKAPDDRENVRD